MTVSDLPLAPATAVLPEERPRRARVRTRVRARVAATAGNTKSRQWVAVIAADARRSYLVAARPVSARAWVRVQRRVLTRVPADSGALRKAAVVDNWTTGLLLISLSTALLLAAGGVSWVACHPVRRWAFVLIAWSLLAWVVLTH